MIKEHKQEQVIVEDWGWRRARSRDWAGIDVHGGNYAEMQRAVKIKRKVTFPMERIMEPFKF